MPLRYTYYQDESPWVSSSASNASILARPLRFPVHPEPVSQPFSYLCRKKAQGDNGRINTALLRVSRQIYEEASSILYSENHVSVSFHAGDIGDRYPVGRFTGFHETARNLLTKEPRHFGRLQELRIDLYTDCVLSPDGQRSLRFDKADVLLEAITRSKALKKIQIVLHNSMGGPAVRRINHYYQMSLCQEVDMFLKIIERLVMATSEAVFEVVASPPWPQAWSWLWTELQTTTALMISTHQRQRLSNAMNTNLNPPS